MQYCGPIFPLSDLFCSIYAINTFYHGCFEVLKLQNFKGAFSDLRQILAFEK